MRARWRPARMVLWLDEMVPGSLADFVVARGHELHLVRHHFVPGTADSLIAAAVDVQGGEPGPPRHPRHRADTRGVAGGGW